VKQHSGPVYKTEDSDSAEIALRNRHARRKWGLAEIQSQTKSPQQDIKEDLESNEKSRVLRQTSSAIENVPGNDNDTDSDSAEKSPLRSPMVTIESEYDSDNNATSPRRRGLSADEEEAMKERIVMRKMKLAETTTKQESEIDKPDEISKKNLNKLVSKLLEKAIDDNDSIVPEDYEKADVMQQAISLVENLRLDDPVDDDDFNDAYNDDTDDNIFDTDAHENESEEDIAELLKHRHSERKRQLAEKEKEQEAARIKQKLEEEAAAEAVASALMERLAERKRQLAEKEKSLTHS